MVDNGGAGKVVTLTGTATAGSLFVNATTTDIDVAGTNSAKTSYNLNAVAGNITDASGTGSISAPTVVLTAGTSVGATGKSVVVDNGRAAVNFIGSVSLTAQDAVGSSSQVGAWSRIGSTSEVPVSLFLCKTVRENHSLSDVRPLGPGVHEHDPLVRTPFLLAGPRSRCTSDGL